MKNSKKRVIPEGCAQDWVNVYDDEWMDELGILYRKPGFVKDPSVWTKTPKEKEALKKARRIKHKFASLSVGVPRPMPFYDKLIIQFTNDRHLKKVYAKNYGKVPSKTTISIKCGQSDIPNVIGKYVGSMKDKLGNDIPFSLVAKYKWNGTWYTPDQLPYMW